MFSTDFEKKNLQKGEGDSSTLQARGLIWSLQPEVSSGGKVHMNQTHQRLTHMSNQSDLWCSKPPCFCPVPGMPCRPSLIICLVNSFIHLLTQLIHSLSQPIFVEHRSVPGTVLGAEHLYFIAVQETIIMIITNSFQGLS